MLLMVATANLLSQGRRHLLHKVHQHRLHGLRQWEVQKLSCRYLSQNRYHRYRIDLLHHLHKRNGCQNRDLILNSLVHQH